jgi:hypothetical protein
MVLCREYRNQQIREKPCQYINDNQSRIFRFWKYSKDIMDILHLGICIKYFWVKFNIRFYRFNIISTLNEYQPKKLRK